VKVSVILPTYNEAGNIVELIRQIIQVVSPKYEYEILVMDDNSPDKTFEIVKSAFPDDLSVVPVLRTAQRGLAYAIRAGVDKASGDQIVIMDTDFTHDPKEIPKMLHVAQIYGIVSGSRFCAGGNMQDAPHYLASRIYNEFMRFVLRTQIQDNLGGYFTISAEKLRSLPIDKIFFGYGDYFFRLLYFAELAQMSIVELPAKYAVRTKGVSKSNFFKMLFTYTIAMLKLRFSDKEL
jgi:dolichol-phosphate mannosyltransferase